MNTIVASKILELSHWLNELSPKRRVLINAKSLRVINSLLISEISPQRGVSIFHKVWAVEKKMKSCLDIRDTATEWINGNQRIMLEFMIAQMTEA